MVAVCPGPTESDFHLVAGSAEKVALVPRNDGRRGGSAVSSALASDRCGLREWAQKTQSLRSRLGSSRSRGLRALARRLVTRGSRKIVHEARLGSRTRIVNASRAKEFSLVYVSR